MYNFFEILGEYLSIFMISLFHRPLEKQNSFISRLKCIFFVWVISTLPFNWFCAAVVDNIYLSESFFTFILCFVFKSSTDVHSRIFLAL